MKVFLEIEQVLSSEDMEKGVPPVNARLDVTGKTDEEIKDLAKQVASLLGLTDYKAYKHICYHDEDIPKPCEIIGIENA